MTKSAENDVFGQINLKDPKWETSFLVQFETDFFQRSYFKELFAIACTPLRSNCFQKISWSKDYNKFYVLMI